MDLLLCVNQHRYTAKLGDCYTELLVSSLFAFEKYYIKYMKDLYGDVIWNKILRRETF